MHTSNLKLKDQVESAKSKSLVVSAYLLKFGLSLSIPREVIPCRPHEKL